MVGPFLKKQYTVIERESLKYLSIVEYNVIGFEN